MMWIRSAFGLFLFALLMPPGRTATETLDEVIVTARKAAEGISVPQSLTVLDARTIRSAGVQHLEDVLGIIPNLNWASGTARPHFFQLRGIGEVEQYQGAPNPSVGFLIDDIDFSGVGMPATLFDTEQITVLRGPQGTTYGANALGGLISVRTADPSETLELKGELTGGSFDTHALGMALSNRLLSDTAAWRLSAQRYRSDGFRHNVYLGEHDTNGFDETSVRGKLRWTIAEGLQADLALMYVDIDDGYDAWSIDNSKTTRSDRPGQDAQRSRGAALRLSGELTGLGALRSVASIADSTSTYSFDGDWGNNSLWGDSAPYDYFQSDLRKRRTLAEDLRLIGDPARALFGRLRWTVGLYAARLTESDAVEYRFDDRFYGAGTSALFSWYRARTLAPYGSLETDVGTSTTLSAGLRLERRDASYRDSVNVDTPFPNQVDRMIGGNLSLTHRLAEGRNVYATLARGYKGGGFNIGSQMLSEQRSFHPEALWNAETGLKWAQERLQVQADVFYMRRRHMQVYLSQQLQPDNPLAYVFFTQNASDGENYGVEGEARYILSERWSLSGSGAWLRARYRHVTGEFVDLGLDDRSQPFAPSYQLSAALDHYADPKGLFARFDVTALGSFYFHANDNQVSSAHQLGNLRIGYRRGPVAISAWGRNLFDTPYAHQGFRFGLIPPDFPTQSFIDRGNPRQWGITLDYELDAASP